MSFKLKYDSKLVRTIGTWVIYFGAFNFFLEHIHRYIRNGTLAPTPASVATEFGITAIIVAGLCTLTIGKALKNIEDKIASNQAASINIHT